MPHVRKLLQSEGTTFEQAFFTYPLCCPSRASILTGQYPHNHKVISNLPPSGGEPRFRALGHDRSTVATWIKKAGYQTAYIGKYLNRHQAKRIPPGWERWFVKPGVDDPVFADEAVNYVRNNVRKDSPFFLVTSFKSSHWPATYEQKYARKFRDVQLPKPPNFNEEDRSDKPSYVRDRRALTNDEIREMTDFYRDRLRSLQTADAAISRMVSALRDAHELHNTYIVFWTDNGYHLGNHALSSARGGKSVPYEEDIRFPLIVRGPGVSKNVTSERIVLNTDLAPTFAAISGARVPSSVDGRSLLPLWRGNSPAWRDAALIEGWAQFRIPTYKAVRTARYSYIEYASGERELYDLVEDPYQLENSYELYKRTHPALVAHLKARLDALKACRGNGCRAAEDGDIP